MNPLPTPQRTADGCDTLYHSVYAQTYHSTKGALTEAQHVFLEGTSIAKVLQQKRTAHVLEIGFGTGLNFLLTAREAEAASATLHFVSLEKEVLPASLLDPLNHGATLQATTLQEAFIAGRKHLPETPPPGAYRLALSEHITLDLLVGDATTTAFPAMPFDAVFLDAFSPDANPELWTDSFLARLHEVLNPGGKLATYSAKGSVRRALMAAGFTVKRRLGPPGKREMLVGIRS